MIARLKNWWRRRNPRRFTYTHVLMDLTVEGKGGPPTEEEVGVALLRGLIDFGSQEFSMKAQAGEGYPAAYAVRIRVNNEPLFAVRVVT